MVEAAIPALAPLLGSSSFWLFCEWLRHSVAKHPKAPAPLSRVLDAMYQATAQYAKHSHDESVNLKKISSRKEALELFDEFDWEGQAEEARRLQRVSPTLSIVTERGDDLVWVSVGMEDGGALFYVTDCAVQKGEKSLLFGLLKRPNFEGSSNDYASKETARDTIEECFKLLEPGGRV